MRDYPISCFTEGAKAAVSGVAAFVAGMIGGTITATLQSYYTAKELWMCLIIWPLLIVYTLAHLWGLLLVPFLAIMFYGLVWREWNRLVGIGAISIATTTKWLLSKQHNPFGTVTDSITFTISIAVAVCFIWMGIVLEKRKSVQQVVPPYGTQGADGDP